MSNHLIERGARHRRKTDILLLILLIVAGLKFTYRLENVLDIHLYDETHYMYRGLKIAEGRLPNPEAAPLYSLWYSALSFFQSDRVKLYYLNWKLVCILLPVAAFILIRRWKSPAVSLVFSFLVLVSTVNWNVWTKPAHFATVIIVLFLAWTSRIRNTPAATLVLALGALVSSYVRPDLFVAYLALVLVYIVNAIMVFARQRRVRVFLGIIPFLVLSFLPLKYLGQPAFGEKGNRSQIAFGQHFSLNWVRWTGSDLNPWTNWKEIVTLNFDDEVGLGEALRRNPGAFFRHISQNVRNVGAEMFKLANDRLNIVLPENSTYASVERIGILAFFLFLAVSRGRKWIPLIGLRFQRTQRSLLFFLILSLPGIMSCVVIYPKDYYLLLPLLLILVTIVLFAAPDVTKESGSIGWSKATVLGLVMVALTPCVSQSYKPKWGTANLETIKFVRSMGISRPVNMLEAEGGFYVYLGDNFRRIAETHKKTDFNDFLKEKQINMIVVTDYLKKDSRFKNDPEWLFFLQNHTESGFKRHGIPNTGWYLLAKGEAHPLPR